MFEKIMLFLKEEPCCEQLLKQKCLLFIFTDRLLLAGSWPPYKVLPQPHLGLGGRVRDDDGGDGDDHGDDDDSDDAGHLIRYCLNLISDWVGEMAKPSLSGPGVRSQISCVSII